MAEILMCPPDYFGIEYEINPWMSRARDADHEAAVSQWNQLKSVLQHAGASIQEMSPVRRPTRFGLYGKRRLDI